MGKENIIRCICGSMNVETIDAFKRTGPPKNPPASHRGKMMSYGYRFKRHTCNVCNTTWEGKRI